MSHTVYAVWQYQLKPTTRQEIEMPWGSTVLKLAVHTDMPCLWVLVNTMQTGKSYREFRLYETDEEIPDREQLSYLGSVGTEVTVLHCFEAVRVVL